MLDLAPHNPYGLRLSSPVLAAAGCFGYGVEYARSVDMRAIGAIVTRSTSLQGRRGRPLVLETPAGLLLAGTWPNPGLAHVLDRYAPTWAGWSTPVILSIIGANADEYGAIAAALEGAEGIAGIELNLAAHAEQSARIVAAARKATQLPLLAKLPHSPDTVALGQAAADAGADALVLFAPFGGSAGWIKDTAATQRWVVTGGTREVSGSIHPKAQLPRDIIFALEKLGAPLRSCIGSWEHKGRNWRQLSAGSIAWLMNLGPVAGAESDMEKESCRLSAGAKTP